MGILAFIYGAVSYAIFLAVFLYAIAFVGDFGGPKTIDYAGPAGSRRGSAHRTSCCWVCSRSSTA